MMQIAGALQAEPSFFFDGSPTSGATGARVNGKPNDPLDRVMASRTGIELAPAFVKIKNSGRKALLVRIAEEFTRE